MKGNLSKPLTEVQTALLVSHTHSLHQLATEGTSQHLVLVILELADSVLGVSGEGSGCFRPDLGFHRGHLAEAGPAEQPRNERGIDQQRQHHNAGGPHGDLQQGKGG